jgi:hypothetical protein
MVRRAAILILSFEPIATHPSGSVQVKLVTPPPQEERITLIIVRTARKKNRFIPILL